VKHTLSENAGVLLASARLFSKTNQLIKDQLLCEKRGQYFVCLKYAVRATFA
jgi:hypothetical protein